MVNGQLDRAVLADLGPYLERQADVFALYGLERVNRVAATGVGELACDKGHVLANHDLGLFVVQRQQIWRRQHIAAARLFQKPAQKTQHIDPVGLGRHTQVDAPRHGRCAGRSSRGQVDDIADALAKIGAQQPDIGIAGCAQRALPLNAKLGRPIGADFGNQAFYKHLGAARIQPVNHSAQLPVLRLRCGDDQRVGGRISLDLATRGRSRGAARRGCAKRSAAGRTHFPADGSAQGCGKLGGISVFEVDHMNVSGRVLVGPGVRLVEFAHQ